MKVVAENKSVHFEYEIEDTFEAGISLDGGEIKSVRLGKISLKDSYCSIYKRSIYIKNMNISVYDKAGAYNIKDAKRDRLLLLHREEINKLSQKVAEKGFTLVPVKLYFKGSLLKVEIALAKGKHTYDKKQSLKNKDIERDTNRELKNYK